jgi:hypothetical protein
MCTQGGCLRAVSAGKPKLIVMMEKMLRERGFVLMDELGLQVRGGVSLRSIRDAIKKALAKIVDYLPDFIKGFRAGWEGRS